MADPPVGVTIIEELEADYGFELDEAAIYDRLNDLADKGLLNKKLTTEDRRKKGYYTTAIGKGIVKNLHDKWSTPVFNSD
jgi:DNA-binding PadR family transcriptional regulator